MPGTTLDAFHTLLHLTCLAILLVTTDLTLQTAEGLVTVFTENGSGITRLLGSGLYRKLASGAEEQVSQQVSHSFMVSTPIPAWLLFITGWDRKCTTKQCSLLRVVYDQSVIPAKKGKREHMWCARWPWAHSLLYSFQSSPTGFRFCSCQLTETLWPAVDQYNTLGQYLLGQFAHQMLVVHVLTRDTAVSLSVCS